MIIFSVSIYVSVYLFFFLLFCVCLVWHFLYYIFSGLNYVLEKTVRKGQPCLTANMCFNLQFLPLCGPWPTTNSDFISQRNSISLLWFELYNYHGSRVLGDYGETNDSFDQPYLLGPLFSVSHTHWGNSIYIPTVCSEPLANGQNLTLLTSEMQWAQHSPHRILLYHGLWYSPHRLLIF